MPSGSPPRNGAARRERQNRRLRRSLVGLGVVTILALIAGLVAVVQSNRADDQANEAQAQAALAAQRVGEPNARARTSSERARCGRGQRTAAEDAAAQATAAEADTAFINLTNTSLLERGNRQDLAALLAIEAYRIDPERVAVGAVLDVHPQRRLPRLPTARRCECGARSRSARRRASEALAALDGGRLVRFDIASGSIVQTLDPIDSVDDPVDEATMLRLSGDGRIAVLAVQGDDAMTWRAYDVASGQPVAAAGDRSVRAERQIRRRPWQFEGFGDASLSTDGALLAIGGGVTGQVLVFATADGSTVGTANFPPPYADEWSIPAHTASVLFDTDGTLYVGVPVRGGEDDRSDRRRPTGN